MSSNPYEASPPPAIASPNSYASYHSAQGIAAWASWWLLGTSLFEMLFGIPLFFLEPYLEADPLLLEAEMGLSSGMVMALFLGVVGTACLAVVANVVGIVLYCVWAYRANAGARALGAEGMEFTPGWTVGWHFVPIMNLFKPYQAIKEVYQASDPEADVDTWKRVPIPGWLGAWWTMWIVSNVVGQIEMRAAFSDSPEMLMASRWIALVSTIVGLIAAFLVFKVIRTIQQRQSEKAHRRSMVKPQFTSDPATAFRDFA